MRILGCGVLIGVVGCGSSAFVTVDAGGSGSSARSGTQAEAGASGSGPAGSAAGASGSSSGGSGSQSAGASSGATGGCIPGASVACVGPGGCAGGQVCDATGSGYGTCDCAATSSGNRPAASSGSGTHSGSDSGASSGSAATAGASSGGSGTCLAVGTICTSTPNACCSGICQSDVSDPTQPALCAAACTSGAGCESGCCAPLQNSTLMSCAPRGFCSSTCAATATSCTESTDCCLGANNATPICIAFTSGALCGVECTDNSQCDSGCCAPLMGSPTSACLPKQYCP